ncbi:MAG: peptidylprolyl isomerase [Candidatus Andersenbacteria bacterium]
MKSILNGLLVAVILLAVAGVFVALRAVAPIAETTLPAVDDSSMLSTDDMMVEEFAQDVPADLIPLPATVEVTLTTNKGDIAVTLHGEDAPLTVGNFVKLAQEDFYDGTTFHRVIPDFMVQGGDPLSRDAALRVQHGTGGPGYTFPDEINDRKLVRGSLAMANAGPSTNGSQFFIVTAEATPHLDGLHTNFGTVTAGMEVVDAIVQVERDDANNPLEPVVITDIVVNNISEGTPLIVE